MRKSRRNVSCGAVLLVLGLFHAGAGTALAEGWTYQVAPYLWGSGLDGEVGIGPVTAPAEASFSDLVENLCTAWCEPLPHPMAAAPSNARLK